jgi:hypothetical protein
VTLDLIRRRKIFLSTKKKNMDLKIKVLLILLHVISNLIAISAALAGWYQSCSPLELSKRAAYVVVFLPLIAGSVVLLLLGMDILPWKYTDEVMTITSIASNLIFYVTLINHLFGKCRKCKVN